MYHWCPFLDITVSKKRKTVDECVPSAKKYKYKKHVPRLEPSIILGDGIVPEDIPYSKSDRLTQVALAISETGGGMDRGFSALMMPCLLNGVL